jgi:hypothetical protein
MYNNKTRVNFINSACKKSHNLLSLENKKSQAVSVRWSLEDKKNHLILWVNYMHFYGKSQTREKKKRRGTAHWLTENRPYPHIFCHAASMRKMAQAEICEKCAA